jgi:hypothetical protein
VEIGKAVEAVELAQTVTRMRPVVAAVAVVELDAGAAVPMSAFMVVLLSVKEAA